MNASQTPADRLAADLLATVERFERERRAERIAAGGDPDEDRDPLELVRAIADNYTAHRNEPDADAMYDELAHELSLDDVRALRIAAEAAAAITPRLIESAAGNGQPVASIARDLAVSESYVYRVLRERKARQDAGLGEPEGDPNTVCHDIRPNDRQKWPARCERQLGHKAPSHRGRGGDGVYHDWPVIAQNPH
ncbi:hypothetical protein [Streptomyces nigra]|uniref:hypothetical protein n=1 Tax=Streptomyces nigra TaxID=1827580 RepID=UPI00380BC3CE